MILPDVNLLIYAFNSDAPRHAAARAWWEETLSESRPLGLPWAVSLGFVRLMTHRRVLAQPLSATVALGHVRDWLKRRHVQVLVPGPRHLALVDELLREAGTAGALTTDTHLAALAIEYQAELCSTDLDFGRFAGLRWRNPLASVGS